jgi:hypothetical protein
MILIESQQQSSVWSSVLPFVTLVLGWGLSQLTEHFKANRDRAANALERREDRLLRRDEFQRETLLSLQEALTGLSESAGMKYGHRIQSDNPDSVLVPHSLLEAYRKANTQTSMLKARVQDEAIRMSVNNIQIKFTEADDFPTREKARQALSDALQLLFHLNDRIGQVLRELDTRDDQVGDPAGSSK